MDDNKIAFRFSSEVLKVFSLAYRISVSCGFPCVTDLACFAALNSLSDSPLYKRVIHSGFDQNNISKVNFEILSEYQLTCRYQVTSKVLIFGVSSQSYPVSDALYSILEKASIIGKDFYQKEEIGYNELLAAFAECMPNVYETFLKKCDIYPKPNNLLLKEEKKMHIPNELSSCLSVLNSKFSPKEASCKILGRDDETLRLIRILAKDTKRNAVLVGEPGVGKTALVEKFTWMIVTGNCPSKFKNSIVVSLDINSIIAGTQYRGSAELRFQKLIAFLEENQNCILFIDEIHNLLGAGACREGDLDLANALKPILARGTTQVIGATTLEEYDKYFSKDGALKRRFEKIVIKEPKVDEVYPMIKNQIERLAKSHHTTISKEMVDIIIFYASCFNYETKNPDRTLDLIDKAMAMAELNGKEEVCKEDVLNNFDINTKVFQKTPLITKIALAYHEAGHYILHRFSNELCEYNILAVSIMPADDYYGVNVFEIDTDIIPSRTREYYIQLIGSKLGGRVAEKLYSNKLSSGASKDLEVATRIAQNMVTKYGLDESFSQSRVYLDGPMEQMYSEEVRNHVNRQVNQILEEAKAYAESVLTKNYVFLEILVDALLEKGMLSAAEIDELFQNTKKVIPEVYTVDISTM